MEEVLLDTMYELPSRTDVARVVIDGDVVRDRVNPTLVPITDLAETDLPEERSA
jgi:ATP-dependent Clp protease ATP-binding subunit ClpX